MGDITASCRAVHVAAGARVRRARCDRPNALGRWPADSGQLTAAPAAAAGSGPGGGARLWTAAKEASQAEIRPDTALTSSQMPPAVSGRGWEVEDRRVGHVLGVGLRRWMCFIELCGLYGFCPVQSI